MTIAMVASNKQAVAESMAEPATRSVAGHWHARLELQFAHTQRGTRLVKAAHEGPLYVQKPFYPEGPDLAHVYPLHPPGGMVSGDELLISLQATENAQALITTPGAARVYRARPDRRLQKQRVRLVVEPHASLEWLPLENIIYPDAHACLQTHVELAAGGRFIGWEVTSLGLPASGKTFAKGQLRQRFVVCQAGRPVFIDKLTLTEQTRALFAAKVGLQSQPINGVFVAGPFAEGLQDPVMEQLRNQITAEPARPYMAGISLCGQFLVGRYLGACSEQGRELFIRWWELVRPVLLQRTACAPRIWLT